MKIEKLKKIRENTDLICGALHLLFLLLGFLFIISSIYKFNLFFVIMGFIFILISVIFCLTNENSNKIVEEYINKKLEKKINNTH